MTLDQNPSTGKKRLLLAGSGQQAYREYALESMATCYAITLLDSHEPTWQAKYIEKYLKVDFDSPSLVMDTVKPEHELKKFCGVVTYDEWLVPLASAVARELGLPANDMECSHRCRDKHLMRKALAEHGVPSARSLLVRSLSEAHEAVRKIGFPLVMKPQSLAASIGVVKVETIEEMEDAFSIAASAFHPEAASSDSILVEEFLPGPEVSVESIVRNGEPTIVSITRKRVGFAPFFEELGHMVCAEEALPEDAAIRTVAVQAHHALGINVGATHAELRLTPDGPRMVELAARLGGDLIPKLVQLATGVDLARAAADVASGIEPDLNGTKNNCAAILFLYPKEDCRFVEVENEVADCKPKQMDACVHITAQPGDELRLPPRGFGSRFGYILVEGEDSFSCLHRLEAIAQGVRIRTEPLVRRSHRRTPNS